MAAAGSGPRAPTGGGFPLLPLTLAGTTAAGGAVLAGFLVVRRKTFLAALVVTLGATAVAMSSPPAATAQEEPVARATFSGVPVEIEILDVEPPIDFEGLHVDGDEAPEPASPWTVTKPLDRASPALIDAVVTGEEFRCVEFRFPADPAGPARATFALSGVRVAKVHHTAASAAPTERVELHFERAAFRYWPETGRGSRGQPVDGVLP